MIVIPPGGTSNSAWEGDTYSPCNRYFSPVPLAARRFPKYGYGELKSIPPADSWNNTGNYIGSTWTGQIVEITSPDYETLGFNVENITGSAQLSSYKVEGEKVYFGPQAGPNSDSLHVYTGNNSSEATKVYRYRSEGTDLPFKFLWLRIETRTRQEAIGPDCVREVFIVDEDLTGQTYEEDGETISCSDQDHITYYYFLIGSSPNFEEAADISLPYGMPSSFTDKFPVIGVAQGDNSSRPNEKTMVVTNPGNYMLEHNRTQNTWVWHVNNEPTLDRDYTYRKALHIWGAQYNWRQVGPPQNFLPALSDNANCILYNNFTLGLGSTAFMYGGSNYQGTGSLSTWAAGTNVAAGSKIKTNTIDSRLGLVFVCKRSGYTGATEPAWPTIAYREDNGIPLEGFVEETPADSQGRSHYEMPFDGIFDVGDKIKINYYTIAASDSFEVTVASSRTGFPDIAADLVAAANAGGHTSKFQTGFTYIGGFNPTVSGITLTAIDGNTYSVSVEVTTANSGTVELKRGALWAAESAVFEALVDSSPSAIIELYELTLVEDIHGSNQAFYFYPGQTNDDRPIMWRGVSYVPLPVKAEGFEYTNTQLPRPSVTINNLDGAITALMNASRLTTPNNDLNGAKFIRRRTMAEFLDAATWPAGQAPSWNSPSPDTEFPMESYVIDRKAAETRDYVQFELSAKLDLHGIRSPKRQCVPNICQWTYRSGECSYSGAPCADEDDQLITSIPGNQLANNYYNAKAALATSKQQLVQLRDIVQEKVDLMNAAEATTWALASSSFIDNDTYVIEDEYEELTAYEAGNMVSLSQIYRKGDLVEETVEGQDDDGFYKPGEKKYKLDKYQAVGSIQAANNYNQAQAAYDAHITQSWQPAVAARDAALQAWQASATYAADVKTSGDKCGKLLSSCKLRFKDSDGNVLIGPQDRVGELPFGSYPGVGTFLV
tara:strand:+ start:22602 stop:25433 length:2832 start_codon:yes stop_codon:yes gene_type:complete